VLVRFKSVQPKTQGAYPVHNLNTHLNYTTIQAAIDAPQTLDGQTILIDAQTYYEHVVVNKSLLLIGGSEDRTIVDGNGTGNIIHIIASGVTIKNLTVTNGTIGIILDSSNNATITRNDVLNNDYEGIYLKGCSNGTISHNNVADSRDGIVANSSSNNAISYNNVTGNSNYGIGLNSSSNDTISYDNVTSNYEGVYIEYSNNSCVTRIIATKNSGDAIVVRYSHNSTIQQSIAGNNAGRGIFVTNSNGFNVNNNNVYSNEIYGINANFSTSGLIKQNEANKNSFDGIGVFNSGDCIVTENDVSNGTLWGILVDGSYNISIYNNNIINNPLQAGSTGIGNTWDDGYPSGGNYWSDYLTRYPNAAENDNSGIWNTPYVIDANNTDHYPLMHPWSPLPVHNINTILGYATIQTRARSFNTAYNFGVHVVSNSLISDFDLWLSVARQAALTINISGTTGAQGFDRICIPNFPFSQRSLFFLQFL
jgi:parallel beta-helix repeat protein